MRDAAGRVRDEQLATPPDENGSSTQSGVQVIDPISMQHTQWNNDTKTVVTSPIPPSLGSYHVAVGFCKHRAAPNASAAQSGNANPSAPAYESLGTRTIEGVRVIGCRITSTQLSGIGASPPITNTAEIWVSPELQILVLDTVCYSDGSGRLTRLTRIRRPTPIMLSASLRPNTRSRVRADPRSTTTIQTMQRFGNMPHRMAWQHCTVGCGR